MEFEVKSQEANTVAALKLLRTAEELIANGETAGLEAALGKTESALEALRPGTAAGDRWAKRIAASAWLLRGNALRETGMRGNRALVEEAYAAAEALFEEVAANEPLAGANDLANVWTNRGLALLRDGTSLSLGAAVSCFEKAIGLRASLPPSDLVQYGLAAGWMNRGDALTQLGSAEKLIEAVRSYNVALRVLEKLPVHENRLYLERRAIAWINRGISLEAQGSPAAFSAALDSIGQAISLLEPRPITPSLARVLATAWMNRGTVLLRLTPIQPAEARKAALQALSLLGSAQEADVSTPGIAIQVRHLLCRACAALLLAGDSTAETRDELLAEATSAVDEGLQLARQGGTDRIPGGQALVVELFRFGVKAYQAYQPHFLTEFLLDNLDPQVTMGTWAANPAVDQTARDALFRTFQEICKEGFKTIHTSRFESVLEKLRELRIAEVRLNELRERYLNPKIDLEKAALLGLTQFH